MHITKWKKPIPACMSDCFSHTWLFQPYGLEPARLLCPWDSPGKNTGVVCHALQGIFPTQGSILYVTSPALAGGFLTTGTTWEIPLVSFPSPEYYYDHNTYVLLIQVHYIRIYNSYIPGGAVSGSSWQTRRCQVRSPFEKGLIPSPRVQPTGSLQPWALQDQHPPDLLKATLPRVHTFSWLSTFGKSRSEQVRPFQMIQKGNIGPEPLLCWWRLSGWHDVHLLLSNPSFFFITHTHPQ